ncbi:MAG: SelB C-terminal domain-containing protein, partial [Acidimicrobiia bacterium]
SRIDAELAVADGVEHPITSKGAYLLSMGTGEWAVTMRLIGAIAIDPGTSGPVRFQLPVAVPLLPGDRYVLREAGRSEVVGGGTVLDVEPVLPLKRARPDRDPYRVVAERGWIDVDDLTRLTGRRLPATVGDWIGSPEAIASATETLWSRIDSAGIVGVDLSELTERDRALVNEGRLSGVEVRFGNVRRAGVLEEVDDHPWVAALREAPFAPPPPFDIEPAQLRLLQRNGTVVTLDGIYFHATALDLASAAVVALLGDHPEGVTVAQVRDALGSSRKHVLPLLNRLDHRGITARDGDVRRLGPRASAAPT